jgi:glycosyltransferase involved in cell wall biosynthesis
MVKVYFRYQAGRMLARERTSMPKMALNLAVSDLDRGKLQEISPESRVEVLPNAVDVRGLEPLPPRDDRNGLLFIGGDSWFPNRDAMEFFCQDILPRIRRVLPDYPVTWLARTDAEASESLSKDMGIDVVGWVERVEPFFSEAACYVVPLRVGSGTRLKIIEAWAMGAAVVSTTLGAEGLEGYHEDNILLADTPEAFAEAVLEVVASPDLQQSLGRRGRETATRLYDWDSYREGLVGQYLRLIPWPGGG